MPDRTCIEEGCDEPVLILARQLCKRHYKRLQKRGHVPPLPPLARFWHQVDRRAPDECWVWTGYRNRWGYGQFGGRPAHRVAFESTFGPIDPPTEENLRWQIKDGRRVRGCRACDRRRSAEYSARKRGRAV